MSEKHPILLAATASPIDWSAIHLRLERAAALLEQKAAPDTVEKKRILHERAKALAHEAKADDVGERIEVVEFILASERYAVASSWVREVYPLKEITPLPGTPLFVRGIVNVRGQIVSVVDLKKFFELPEKGLGDLNKLLILTDGQIEFGLLADAVPGVREIPLHAIQPPLPTLTGIRAEYLMGVTAERLIVLDVGKLLADPKIRVSQSAEA